MTEVEKKMMKVMVALIDQNEKLMKKLKGMDETLETVAESIDTLIEIESARLKK